MTAIWRPDQETSSEIPASKLLQGELSPVVIRQVAPSGRRLRRRATMDAALLVVFLLLVCQLSGSTAELLRNAMIAAAIGTPLFLWRRGADLAALARADRWRDDAVRGRGISLADWHAGRDLSPWAERRPALRQDAAKDC